MAPFLLLGNKYLKRDSNMQLLKQLSELRMDRTTFSKVMADSGILMGFEAEVYFPGAYEVNQEIEILDLRDEIKGVGDVENIWKVSSMNYNFVRKFNSAYIDWRHEKIMDWVEEHFEEYEGEARDEIGDDADQREINKVSRQLATDAAPDHLEVSEDDYINNDMEAFINLVDVNLDFLPSYGWENKDKFLVRHLKHESNKYEDVAKFLGHYVSGRVISGNDKFVRKDSTSWYVEPDGSLDDTDEQYGVEIVSPPMSPEGFREAIVQVWRMFNDYNCSTDSTTGLHVSVSLEGKPKIDYLKLALFVDEGHVLNMFDRLESTMTKSQLQHLAAVLTNFGTEPAHLDSLQEFIDVCSEIIGRTGKYMGFNIEKYENQGYIEFRMLGGNYLPKRDQILEMSERFATCMKIAADPNAERNSYLKKLGKFFSYLVDQGKVGDTEKAMKDIYADELVKAVNDTSLSSSLRTSKAMIFLVKMARNKSPSFKVFNDIKRTVDKWKQAGLLAPMDPQELVDVSTGLRAGNGISTHQAEVILNRYGLLKSQA